MKYCPKCGAQCEDDAAFCSVCGEKLVKESTNNENNSVDNPAKVLGILALVFGLIGLNIVGIICGAVGLTKNPDDTSKSLCIIGLVLSIIHMAVQLVVWLLAGFGVIGGFFYL